ncbi:MAG: UDP-N-acetylglucosamine--N-acetylmuramyl-(pentapeptide) pyrophosphoryl-undecaprenol N-acetylglucosamine transferase [Clostridia bacterium]|nr:UDP-N-acetylglucosamine--N-acetylmuramyl-(pentapeptide) pyrophosphoryl-undecaprenol N-acetylglucosamine transferase [Clostridia bacterium]
MRVLITGGGTGGHINPALAIGNHLRKMNPDWVIKYAGNPARMEGKLVPAAGFELLPIEVEGLSRGKRPKDLARNLRAVLVAAKARMTASGILRSFKPDLVIGVGGYVTWPTVSLAAKRGIKTVIHEQNAFPGVTTKLLASKVDLVLLPNEAAGKRLKNVKKAVVVGNPIRDDFYALSREEARRQIGLKDEFFVVSAGGSLGAKVFNERMAQLLCKTGDLKNCRFYHGTGRGGYEDFCRTLRENGVDFNRDGSGIQVVEFITNMPTALNAADLVISRAGASTLAEIAVCATPSVLIPSPNVTENHQYHNAMVVAEAGGARVITEDQLNDEVLHDIVADLSAHPQKLDAMRSGAHSLAVYDVCAHIYEQIRQLMKK